MMMMINFKRKFVENKLSLIARVIDCFSKLRDILSIISDVFVNLANWSQILGEYWRCLNNLIADLRSQPLGSGQELAQNCHENNLSWEAGCPLFYPEENLLV